MEHVWMNVVWRLNNENEFGINSLQYPKFVLSPCLYDLALESLLWPLESPSTFHNLNVSFVFNLVIIRLLLS